MSGKRVLASIVIGGLAALALPAAPALAVTDTSPPVAVAFNLPEPFVAPGAFFFDLQVTDDISGVASGAVSLVSPSGQDYRYNIFNAGSILSGNANDGRYQMMMGLNENVESGLWTFQVESLVDAAGNEQNYGSGTGLHTPFQITGTATVPDAPEGVSAAQGNGEVDVSWERPANGGSAITGYKIIPRAGGVDLAPVVVPGGDAVFHTVTGLTNGTSYTFTVKAVNAIGDSDASEATDPVTPGASLPTEPPASAVAGDGSATVSWDEAPDDGGSPILGYKIWTLNPFPEYGRVGDPVDVGPTVRSTVITGLTNGTAYAFEVRPYNAVGLSEFGSFTQDVTPVAAGAIKPNPPTNVSAMYSSPNGALVSWSPPTYSGNAPLAGFVVIRWINGVAATTGHVFIEDPTATSKLITGLTPGTTYTFTVRAFNSAPAPQTSVDSVASNAVAIPGTATVPGAPTGVTAQLIPSTTNATVSWTAPTSDGGAPLQGFIVVPWVNGVQAQSGFTLVDGGSATSTTVESLNAGATYTFTVRAVNSVGTGPHSTQSNAIALPTAPGVPTNLVATAGKASVALTWAAPSNNGGSAITSYTVTPHKSGVAQAAVTGVTTTSKTISGLINGGSYTFTVKALNAVGAGPATAQSSPVIPADVPSAPAKPTAVAGNARVSLTWTAPANNGSPITQYNVITYKSGVMQSPGPVSVGNKLNHVVTGLTNGSSYTFAISANNGVNGVSDSSPQSTAVRPRIPTSVTITSAPVTATYNTAMRITGTLKRTDTGAVVTGQSVTLQYRRKGATTAFITWPTPSPILSNASGVVTFATFKVTYPVEMRLVRLVASTSTSAYGPSISPAPYKQIACQLLITPSFTTASTLALGGTAKLKANVQPGRAGKMIYLQRWNGTAFVNVTGWNHTLDTASSWTFSVKPTTRGTFRYRFYMPSTQAGAPFSNSYSKELVLKIT